MKPVLNRWEQGSKWVAEETTRSVVSGEAEKREDI